MPFIFLLIGILFLVLARNGTQGDFEQLLKKEFTGAQSFLVWASAFVILGLIGFWKPIRPVTDALIGLIILVLILENKGLFGQLNSALRNPSAPAKTDALSQTAGSPMTLFNGPNLLPSTSSPITQAPTTAPMLTEIPQ